MLATIILQGWVHLLVWIWIWVWVWLRVRVLISLTSFIWLFALAFTTSTIFIAFNWHFFGFFVETCGRFWYRGSWGSRRNFHAFRRHIAKMVINWTDDQLRLEVVIVDWRGRCHNSLTISSGLLLASLQDLPTGFFLVHVDLKRAFLLFDLGLLNCYEMIKLLLSIFKSVKFGILYFRSLLELSVLTLNSTFENVKLLLELVVLFTVLLIFGFLGHGLWVFEVYTVVFFSFQNETGLLLLEISFTFFHFFTLWRKFNKLVVLDLVFFSRKC